MGSKNRTWIVPITTEKVDLYKVEAGTKVEATFAAQELRAAGTEPFKSHTNVAVGQIFAPIDDDSALTNNDIAP